MHVVGFDRSIGLERLVFRLACAFWFVLGGVLGRALGLAEARGKQGVVGAPSASVKTSERTVGGVGGGRDARSTATSRSTRATPMEVEGRGGVDDGDEAESSFVVVDDEMEDAFVDESEATGGTSAVAAEGVVAEGVVAESVVAESVVAETVVAEGVVAETVVETTTGAPSAFVERAEVEVKADAREEEDFSSAAEDESPNEESDSADTKEKMHFVAEQVFEATSAVDAAEDERARERAEANRIEWERRAEELAKQREEARRLKSIAKKERRMKERSQTFREEAEHRAKEADSLNQYRVSAQETLKYEGLYQIAESGDLRSLLMRLGTHEEGKNIETSYKKALLMFHPDRSAARGGTLQDNARCEETFKILQACRKVWENMGKPDKSFTRVQPTHYTHSTHTARSWSRTSASTYSTSPPNNKGPSNAYQAYKAGQQSADDEARKREAEANAAFVQKAKQEANEAEQRMRTEAARRWRELQKMQREKNERENRAEMNRVDALEKAREREELRKKLEEIKRSAAFPPNSSPDSESSNASPSLNRTVSGTKVHFNVKSVVSPAQVVVETVVYGSARSQSSGSPRSPQSKEETLTRL